MKTVAHRYRDEIAGCPRSPEWKAGALAGMRKVASETFDRCPHHSGTAQADAWAAGFQFGHEDQRAYMSAYGIRAGGVSA